MQRPQGRTKILAPLSGGTPDAVVFESNFLPPHHRTTHLPGDLGTCINKMATKSLLQLPTQLLDFVASKIIYQRDLLSLAVSHSTLRDIVIPFHLHYRLIECTEDDGEMWTHLQDSSRRVENIRTLRLHFVNTGAAIAARYTNPRKPPRSSSGDTRRLLFPVELLKGMAQLRCFEWRYLGSEDELPRFFSWAKTLENYQDSLWAALLKHYPLLEEVRANDSFACGTCPDNPGTDDPSTKTKTVSFRSKRSSERL